MRKQQEMGEVRIIAGQYKGRRLSFPAVPGLRPSGDRIRETVFSWLLPWLNNARVLDLFAGSGALGFEAASRGAREVICNDANAAVAASLREQQQRLNAAMITVYHHDALQLLNIVDPAFDIVFLDPPFRADWLYLILPQLAGKGLIAADGVVYIESERELGEPTLPDGWSWYRVKESGQVRYALARPPAEVG
jgi:16S rRNA (guanine966-N2)-methyltransferase